MTDHWGYDETGQRVLLDVVLGQRERFEDWLEMGRDLVRRGLRAPMLVVTDGAPGLIRAMEELWPDSDRQRCTVHRWRNVAGKLPKNDTQPIWSVRTRARRPAWPRTCRPSACTSRTRSGFEDAARTIRRTPRSSASVSAPRRRSGRPPS
ncbi:MAG: hypothetical protein E6J41_08085 [Chloroflexi bacterium]|nr:MAG: hypothetical protein E6J41_08085 [Chloroflexota bacterium]